MAVVSESSGSESHSPERLILTRLFAAQQRLRFVRSAKAALLWFAAGSGLAALGLVLLWNWNLLPGPWQWLATAGRPREVLWLPILTALGGFFSHWFLLPNPRQAAFGLDKELDSQERLLTAVDWILSEKPRTVTSERLLGQASELVRDEARFRRVLMKLEAVSRRSFALLFSLALPLALLFYLPANVGLTPSSSMWLGEGRVDQLTEDLLKELEQADELDNPEEKLEELLKKLAEKDPNRPPDAEERATKRELQRVIDQMKQQAESHEKARELLETLAQRARQNQAMSEKDKEALETLREKLKSKEQQETLDQAQESWAQEDFDQAAESLEQLQSQEGAQSESLSQQAQEAAGEGAEGDGSQEFDEAQGDQFGEDGFAKGEGQGQGQGQGQGEGEGQGQGEGTETDNGTGGMDAGKGTTLKDEGNQAQGRANQSLRRGDSEKEWLEEYEHLHAPERTAFQKSQTRVRGETGDEGPRFRTTKEGRGAVTQPSDRQGSGGLLEYREEAENAILRDEVPADYRDNVRVYFESLDKRS